jgi:hypothetical protein
MAYGEKRGMIGRTYDFIGNTAAMGVATAAAGSIAAVVFSLGYGLAGAAGLGGFPSFLVGGLATFFAATPVIGGGLLFGGIAGGIAATVGAAIGMRPNGWGMATGVALGLAATFSMVSNMTSREPDTDSQLDTMEPTSVASVDIDDAAGHLSEKFTSAGQEIIQANNQMFVIDAPASNSAPALQV